MYQPRRINEALRGPLPEADAATLAAFRSGPRRAAQSPLMAATLKFAPATLSVAMVATAGAIVAANRPAQTTELLAVPDRADQVSRSDSVREALPQRAIAEGLATSEAAAEPAEGAAPVAAAWSAQFGSVTGKKFAKGAVTVRAQANGDSAAVAELGAGDAIDTTDIVTNGFRQVVVDKKLGWVVDNQLGSAAPKPKAEAKAEAKGAAKAESRAADRQSGRAADSEPAQKATPAAKADPAPSYSGPSKLGLKPKAMVVYNAVMANFSVPSVGGYRSSSRSSHQCGMAIDFMTYTNSGLGDGIANYLVSNAGSFGITHIIWKQRIWTPYKPYWRPMADRGGVTANHYDHVHVALADRC